MIISSADVIIVSMQDAMLRELTEALDRGGPASALGGCHLDAIGVAHRIGREGIAAGLYERPPAQPDQCSAGVGGAARQGQRRQTHT